MWFFFENEERIEILFVCVKILGIFEIVGFVAGLEGIPFNQKMSECRFFTKNDWKNEKKTWEKASRSLRPHEFTRKSHPESSGSLLRAVVSH